MARRSHKHHPDHSPRGQDRPADTKPKKIRRPYTTYAVLCEKAVAGEDGAVTIERIVNKWSVLGARFPFGLSMHMAIGFSGLTNLTSRTVRVDFVLDPELDVLVTQDFELPSDNDAYNLFVDVPLLPVLRAGTYRMLVSHLKRTIAEFPFQVEVVEDLPIQDDLSWSHSKRHSDEGSEEGG